MARYDVIIKNGLVFDGKGNKPEEVDIGISGDEIKKIGDLQKENADEIIDASGKYVAPGFIDLTSHSDTHWTLFIYPSQESLIRQGITTIVGGNCGTSLAPFVNEASLEEIQRWVDVSKININWRTMEEFFFELKKHKFAVNFCTLVGFSTLQKAVLGKEVRLMTENEINQMKLLLKNALKEGAFGLSTNFGMGHVKSLRDEDISDLFKIVKQYEAVASHHLEDEGENILPAISRLILLTRKSEVKMHISHFKALGRNSWNFFPSAIEMIKNARQENVKLTADFFPYTKTGSNLLMLLPSWFRKLSTEEAHKVLQSREDKRRKDLLDYLEQLTLHYDKIIIASALSELGAVGKTIEQLSKISGLAGEEIILSLLGTNNLRVSIFNEVISEENIELIAKEEFSAVASDGVGYQLPAASYQLSAINNLPHPRSFGAFSRVFNRYVKERPILAWENVIYKMTGLPAEILGLKDRGTIAKGKKADIIVFDSNGIFDHATYDNPFQYSSGVEQVLINGAIVLNNEEFTGKFPGYVLRKT